MINTTELVPSSERSCIYDLKTIVSFPMVAVVKNGNLRCEGKKGIVFKMISCSIFFGLGFSRNESWFASHAREHWQKEKWNCSYRFYSRCRDPPGPSQTACGKMCELWQPLVIFGSDPFRLQKMNGGGNSFSYLLSDSL